MSTSEELATKYGVPKLARYLVRSLDDFHDTCETVIKQVQQNVEPEDTNQLMSEMECSAMLLPNTLSSIIVGINTHGLILENHRLRNKIPKTLTAEEDKNNKPQISYLNNVTVVSSEIASFCDLLRLHRFIKYLMQLRVEGLKVVTAKRLALLSFKKEVTNPNMKFTLEVRFPGLLFLEQYQVQEKERSSK